MVDKPERKYQRLAKVTAELKYERALSNAKDLQILRLKRRLISLEQEIARLNLELILQEVFG